jgi:hypothetical protein
MTTRTKKTAKKTKAAKSTKPVATKATAKAKQAPAEKLSQMAAAERVLAEAGEPMNCKAMVEAMGAKGYWTSPGGATPAATLYASLLRHIRQHGKQAKFTKTDRGLFALAGKR